MSTDWSRYALPEQTQRGGLRSGPEDNAVLSLNVGAVRAIPSQALRQAVEHAPIFADPDVPDNRAHSEVVGPKNTETRIHYLRIYRTVLTLPTE